MLQSVVQLFYISTTESLLFFIYLEDGHIFFSQSLNENTINKHNAINQHCNMVSLNLMKGLKTDWFLRIDRLCKRHVCFFFFYCRLLNYLH